MKYIWTLRLGLGALFAALVFGCPAARAAIFPLQPAPGDQQAAAIYGDIVVWEDYRNEETTKGDIYAFNLDSLSGFPVCASGGNQWLPSIWGDNIVWQDARYGTFEVYTYHLLHRLESPVCVNGRAKWNVSIHNNRVSWEEEIAPTVYDIYSTVIGGSGPQAVCTAARSQYEVSVYGDVAVWQDFRNGTHDDIYSYNFITGVETPVCTAAGDQTFPEIWGNKVVWEDRRSGAHIYVKDLSTGVEKKLTTAAGDRWQPVIWGNYVVWQDKRNGNWDIYMYDLAANQEKPLVVAPYDQQFPRIFENKVVYQHGNCGASIPTQVYLTMIAPPSFQSVQTVASARALPVGSAVTISGKVVTRSFGGAFYMEETDRSSGMRVRWPASVNPGSVVTVSGLMRTKAGEREIDATDVTVNGTAAIPRPLHVVQRDMGGVSPWTGALSWVGGSVGTYNVGLLVSTAGRVCSVGSDYFYITDGSTDAEVGGVLPVRVLCGSLTKPVEDQMVLVVGISSVFPTGERAERAVRVQYQDDITVF